MALTADRGELSRGFRRRTGRWPSDAELRKELPRAVRAALDAQLGDRRADADPVKYENAVAKVVGRLEKSARKAARRAP